jgi:hypothetical protein
MLRLNPPPTYTSPAIRQHPQAHSPASRLRSGSFSAVDSGDITSVLKRYCRSICQLVTEINTSNCESNKDLIDEHMTTIDNLLESSEEVNVELAREIRYWLHITVQQAISNISSISLNTFRTPQFLCENDREVLLPKI